MTSKHTKVMLTSAALLTAVLSTTVQAQSETVEKPSSPQTVAMGTDRQSLEQQVQNQEKVVTELTKKVQTAKKNDEAAAQAVEQAKANEASASNVDAQKAEVANQMATAENDVKVANEDVATETKDVEKAHAENQQAQDALKVAENEAAKTSTETKQPSTVELDKDFAEALGTKNTNPDYSEDLNMMGGDNNFTFVTNPGDEQTVDIDNLTDDQLTDLSNYASSLINQVRDQAQKAGVNLTVGNTFVTKGAVQFAKDVAQNYRNDNWDTVKDAHDVKAINRAAADNGLKAVSNENAYEDAGMSRSSTFINRTFTMEDLKRSIFEVIGGMISKDVNSNWKHTESLVGTGLSGEYLGISISRFGDVVTVHVLQVPKSRIQDANKFDTTKLLNPYQGEVNPKAKEVLKQLESARTLAANKAQALATQQSKLQAAKSHVAELTNKVVQLKEQQAQLGNVQSGDLSALVTSAVERKAQTARNLADMQAALDSATAKLNNLKAALATVPAKPEAPAETPANPEAHVETPSKPVQPEAPVKPEKLTPAIPQVPAVPEEAPSTPMTPNNSAKPEASIPSKMDNISKSDVSGKKVVADKGNQAVSREMQPVQKVTNRVMATGPKATAYQALLPKTGEVTNSVTVLGAFMLLIGSLPLVGSYMRKHH